MNTDEIKRRLESLGDDWARLIFQCLLIEWRDESPNIEDSEHWQRDEALRVCACAFEVRRMALDVARRWHAAHYQPVISITREQAEEMGLVKP